MTSDSIYKRITLLSAYSAAMSNSNKLDLMWFWDMTFHCIVFTIILQLLNCSLFFQYLFRLKKTICMYAV